MNSAVALVSLLLALPFSSGSLYSIPLRILKLQAISTFKHLIPNQECASDLISVVTEATNSKLWALKVLDASGKPNPGLSNGNIHLLGDFDHCLSISEEVAGRTIDGQYCTAIVSIKDEALGFLNSSSDIENTIKFANNINLNRVVPMESKVAVLLGLCVPKSCSAENLENVARHVETTFMLPVQSTVLDGLCSYEGKSVEITQLDIVVYSFFIITFLLIISSTIYDTYLRLSGQDSNVLLIFSAYTNLEKLFSQSANTNPSCLHGVNVLSNCWMILAHAAVCFVGMSKNPLDAMTKWRYYNSGIIVWSAFYGLVNFFTVSGFSVSYFYLKYSEKLPINVLLFYLARFVRLTPALLAATLAHTSILKLLTDGPYGPFAVEKLTGACQRDWWRALFYFTGWSKYEECFIHSWFLSVDSQLYLLAPLILFSIRKYPRTVLAGTTLAILTGIVYSVMVTIQMRLGATVFDWNSDFQDYLYLSSLHHSPAWLTGIILGYLLHEKNIRIPRALNLILWMVSMCAMLTLIFYQIVFITEEYDVHRAALWNGLSKPIWSLALSFAILSCATGNGGYINTILSHPVFRVLSQLTYSIYLIHIGVIVIVVGNKRETPYIGYFNMATEFARIFLISVACSVFLYLGFEAPIVALKYHIGKNKNDKKVN